MKERCPRRELAEMRSSAACVRGESGAGGCWAACCVAFCAKPTQAIVRSKNLMARVSVCVDAHAIAGRMLKSRLPEVLMAVKPRRAAAVVDVSGVKVGGNHPIVV